MASDGPPRKIPLVVRILVGIALGVTLGSIGRYGSGSAAVIATRCAVSLGQVGTVIVDLIKGLAGPLLFFAILDAFLRTKVHARNGLLMVAISLTNATIAIAVGLGLSNLIRPGRLLQKAASADLGPGPVMDKVRSIDPLTELVGLIPTNLTKPFLPEALGGSIISLVVVAVLLGLAFRKVKVEQTAAGEKGYLAIENGVAATYRAVEILLGWVILLIPLAVLGVVAKTIRQYGFEPGYGLSAYVGVAILGMVIQVGIIYQLWIVLAARMPLRKFWGGAKEPVIYAMGASSSLATLPVTLKNLDRMGVSAGSARLASCVGTNLNNDGILLYEAMAALCVAQAYGVSLGWGDQMLVALSCMIAGIGIAGVPDAGLISLLVVLTTVKLPLGLYPMLLTVDWLLSRCRAVTNVTSDILVAVLLDRFGTPEAMTEEVQPPDRPLDAISASATQ